MGRGLALTLALAGCGHHRPPEPAAPTVFRPGPPIEPGTDLGPVGAALAATPETRLPARIAIYAQNAELEQKVAETLHGLQGVADAYVVPRYLVDGRSRWTSPYAYPPVAPTPLDLEQLRVVAGMAHCDLLLVVDYGYREEQDVNAWMVFSPLLLPMLFTPWLNADDQSYLDATLVDVRSGYLYGTVSAQTSDQRGPLTLYALDPPGIVDTQRDALLEQARVQLSDLLWYHLLQPSPSPLLLQPSPSPSPSPSPDGEPGTAQVSPRTAPR